MRLRGTYFLTINGQEIAAHNDVTDDGLLLAARMLCDESRMTTVKLGIKNDRQGNVADTLTDHPGWSVLIEAEPVTVLPDGAAIQTDVITLTAPLDGVAGGCYLVVNGTLFSTADFGPQPLVQGDTISAQYRLELSR